MYTKIQVVFDAADPEKLAEFWALALGYGLADRQRARQFGHAVRPGGQRVLRDLTHQEAMRNPDPGYAVSRSSGLGPVPVE